jgi:membrane-bound ClpP family serine protease
MNDSLATLVSYGITGFAIWWFTHKSRSGYIRWQWRRPHWILVRLLVVFLFLHCVFALVGVPAGWGYLVVGLFCGIAFVADWSGVFVLLTLAVGWILREWVFWLPSRHRLILRNRPATKLPAQEHLVGLAGSVVSDLKPTGRINIGGSEYPARSEGKFVLKGTPVVVKAVGAFELRVQSIDKR